MQPLNTLIDADTLAQRLNDPTIRIIDCRFELGDPEAGEAQYRRGHIAGAVYAHLDRDLSGPRMPWTGRHPLPIPDALCSTLGQFGVGPQTQVVAYDSGNGMFAARLWWLLRWLGHPAVAVLDGGLNAWRALGLPISIDTPTVAPCRFQGAADHQQHLDANAVAAALTSMSCVLVDARAIERFEGRLEPLDPRAGHIPGAINYPYTNNLGTDGRFLVPSELRKQLTPLLHGRPASDFISMCGSGVTACHTLFALEIAGLHGGRLYAGSWSEWSRDPARPIATGPVHD